MPLIRDVQDEDFKGRWFVIAEDGGKPVKVQVRPIPRHVDDALRREAYGKVNARKMANLPAVRGWTKSEVHARLRAQYGLVESENFKVEAVEQKAAALYSKLLGEPVTAGAEVCLDGKWGPPPTVEQVRSAAGGLKEHVLEYSPRIAAKISDFAYSYDMADAEEDAELGET